MRRSDNGPRPTCKRDQAIAELACVLGRPTFASCASRIAMNATIRPTGQTKPSATLESPVHGALQPENFPCWHEV